MNNNASKWLPTLIILFIAVYISILPFPLKFTWFIPNWCMLIIIFWCLYVPNSIGIITGFLVGLVMDLMLGTLFGSIGMTTALVTFLSNSLRVKYYYFRMYQKFVLITFMLSVANFIRLWIHLFNDNPPPTNLYYWLPVMTSLVAWPIIFLLLNSYLKFWNSATK